MSYLITKQFLDEARAAADRAAPYEFAVALRSAARRAVGHDDTIRLMGEVAREMHKALTMVSIVDVRRQLHKAYTVVEIGWEQSVYNVRRHQPVLRSGVEWRPDLTPYLQVFTLKLIRDEAKRHPNAIRPEGTGMSS